MEIEEFLKQTRVFFVASPRDNGAVVAIHPSYFTDKKLISWWDSSHERRKEVSDMKGVDHGTLLFRDSEGSEYRFLPMTLDLYNKFVKSRLTGGKDFSDEEEMKKAFEATMI